MARSAFWRSEVLEADARIAEIASEVPQRMPRSLLRMGKLALIHCFSVSYYLVMELTHLVINRRSFEVTVSMAWSISKYVHKARALKEERCNTRAS